MLKFCKMCQENKNSQCPSGYSYWWKDSVKECPNCKGDLIDIDFPTQDGKIIIETSEEANFIEAMIKLRQDDIIEYESRMSQFRTQAQQQEQIEQQQRENSKVRCPFCQSTNVRKISGTERATSVIGLGLFSKKINKSFKCNNCGGTF